MLVKIRESDCIGCTKCIQACPVDAILGSANQMHTVISNECIGCELCIPPCPVDCIDLVHDIEPHKNKDLTLKRSRARKQRLNDKAMSVPTEKSASATQTINNTLARIKAMKSNK